MNESVLIATPDHVTLEFELAGLGSRLLAHVIDFILVTFLCLAFVFGMLFGGLLRMGELERVFQGGEAWTSSVSIAVLILLIFLVVWGYYFLFEWLMRGRTPGKKELGIRVIRQDGLPVGLREAALRNLVRAADALPPPCYLLGGIVMHLDPHGRRLGDMIAGTLVVRERFGPASTTGSAATWAARIEKGHSRQGYRLPGGAVSARQLDLVDQFLQRRHTLPADKREALAWQIAAPLLPLAGEAAEEWEVQAARAEKCERFLIELVEASRTVQVAVARPAPVAGERNSLF